MDTINTSINCSYFPDDTSPESEVQCVNEHTPVVPTAPPSKYSVLYVIGPFSIAYVVHIHL